MFCVTFSQLSIVLQWEEWGANWEWCHRRNFSPWRSLFLTPINGVHFLLIDELFLETHCPCFYVPQIWTPFAYCTIAPVESNTEVEQHKSFSAWQHRTQSGVMPTVLSPTLIKKNPNNSKLKIVAKRECATLAVRAPILRHSHLQ